MVIDVVSVTVAKDAAVSAAALVAAYVGVRGLGTWQRQLRANTEYQLTKNLLTSLYEVREAIAGVRHPFMQYSREPDLPEEKVAGMSRSEKEWHALAQAYQRRWSSVAEAKAKLDANLLEAEVVWGPEIRQKVAPLNGLIGELLVAIQHHIEARNPRAHYDSPGLALVEKFHNTLYAVGDPDPYKERLNQVIEGVESELRPRIAHYHR